jgi:predicted CopG family antitoxin
MRDRLKSLKRGGESYSDLFNRMLEQFDPGDKE